MKSVRNLSRHVAMMVMIAFAVGSVGCTGVGAPLPLEPEPGEREPYVIGIPDALQILVWRNPELSVEVLVRRDGKISVPLVDDVQAEGLTPQELKEVLTEALAEFVTAPDVTVIVKQINSHTVTIVGGVARSGQIPLVRQMRVLDAIATMGGFNIWAKKNQIMILRQNGNETIEYVFNFGAFSSGKAPASNLFLQPGDTVVVPE